MTTKLYQIIVLVAIALMALLPSINALADFVSPPDPAPEGCTTMMTQAWGEIAPPTWSNTHTYKGELADNCGMRITVQYTVIDTNGNVQVITNTWQYLGDDEWTFPDGSRITNHGYPTNNGEIAWESTGYAPSGGKLVRASIFNGTPVDGSDPAAQPTPIATAMPTLTPTVVATELPPPGPPPVPTVTPTPGSSYVCQYPPGSGISTDQCLFQYLPLGLRVEVPDFIIGPGPFPTPNP